MSLNITFLQMKSVLGDLKNNSDKIIDFFTTSKNADLIITPQMSLCGVSPMDNLLAKDFSKDVDFYMQKISRSTVGSLQTLLLGAPYYRENKIYNAIFVIKNGAIENIICKNSLKLDDPFNGVSYFSTKNDSSNIININNTAILILLGDSAESSEKVDLIINLDASHYSLNKHEKRLNIAKSMVKEFNVPVLYCNSVGGVDDIVFDGNSFLLNYDFSICFSLNHTQEDRMNCTIMNKKCINKNIDALNVRSTNRLIYEVILLGLRDFCAANNFKGVMLGVSGGIDSTITAAMAVDALGKENVLGISLPTKYTSKLSREIIEEMGVLLGIKITEVEINDIFSTQAGLLSEHVNLDKNNIADNLQARIRCNMLMAFANNNPDYLLLTTGNKSEIATGYCTLYGDTCGGYNLIKDLYKTQVVALAKWRNGAIPEGSLLQRTEIIPARAITRRPSAELKENQFDEDSLMDYAILDSILYAIVEENAQRQDLYKKFDVELVNKVILLLKNSHYKRMQGVCGVSISERSFGRNYHYNISDKYRINSYVDKND